MVQGLRNGRVGFFNYSKNFYVDWFDQAGSLFSHTVSPMFESSARGQFSVPGNYAGRVLHAKAYTTWMLNFDTAFYTTVIFLSTRPQS